MGGTERNRSHLADVLGLALLAVALVWVLLDSLARELELMGVLP